MKLIIKYVKGEEQKAKNLLKDLKQLHKDFGGFSECAKAELQLLWTKSLDYNTNSKLGKVMKK